MPSRFAQIDSIVTSSSTAVQRLNYLSDDCDPDLLRRPGADGQSNWRVHPLQQGAVDSRSGQPIEYAYNASPAADHSNVGRGRRSRQPQADLVVLVTSRNNHNRRTAGDAHVFERLLERSHDDFDPFIRQLVPPREEFPIVEHCYIIAEHGPKHRDGAAHVSSAVYDNRGFRPYQLEGGFSQAAIRPSYLRDNRGTPPLGHFMREIKKLFERWGLDALRLSVRIQRQDELIKFSGAVEGARDKHALVRPGILDYLTEQFGGAHAASKA